jgi:hypothetical protein
MLQWHRAEQCRWNWIRASPLVSSGGTGESMSADRCRQLAADCLRLAQVANEPSEKALLLEMAERWRLLAAQLEARQTRGSDDEQNNSDKD